MKVYKHLIITDNPEEADVERVKWTDTAQALAAVIGVGALLLSPILEKVWLTYAIAGILAAFVLVYLLRVLGIWMIRHANDQTALQESHQFMKGLHSFFVRLVADVLGRDHSKTIVYVLRQGLYKKDKTQINASELTEIMYYVEALLVIMTERMKASSPSMADVRFMTAMFDSFLSQLTYQYRQKWHPFIMAQLATFDPNTQQNLALAREEFAAYVRNYNTFRNALHPLLEAQIRKYTHEVPAPIGLPA